jgi:hypothetical protein
MLVGRGMEDDLRAQALECGFQARLITDIGNDRVYGQAGEVFAQFEQNLEDAVFAVSEQIQFGRLPACHLAADFAADGAARTRNQNALAAQDGGNHILADAGWLAAQQVGDFHFAQAADADLATQQFIDARHDAEWHALEAADVGQRAQHPPRRRRDGYDDFIHLARIEDRRQVGQRAHDGHAMYLVAALGRVVIQKANQRQVHLSVFLQFTGHQGARTACAHHQHPADFARTRRGGSA